MKKILSVLLSVLLVMGSITCLFTMPAAAETTWETVKEYVALSTVGSPFTAPLIDAKTYEPVNPAFLNDGEWGIAFNAGLLVTTEELKAKTYLHSNGSYVGDVYGTDGEKVLTQVYNAAGRSTTSIFTQEAKISVTEESGVKSLKLPFNSDNAKLMAIAVDSGVKYRVTVSYSSATAGTEFNTAVVSSINVAGATQDEANGKYKMHWNTWLRSGTSSDSSLVNSFVNMNKCSFSRIKASATEANTTYEVSHEFTTPAANVKTVYLAIYNSGSTPGADITTINSITLEKEKLPSTLTVNYETNGGDALASGTFTDTEYTSGITASNLATPTKAGYTFEGWYTDSALTTAFDSATITETTSITLYAKWTEGYEFNFESYTVGDSLYEPTVVDATTYKPEYDAFIHSGKWGLMLWDGLVTANPTTYTSGTIKYAGAYPGNVYGIDGNLVLTQVANVRTDRSTQFTTLQNRIKVVNDTVGEVANQAITLTSTGDYVKTLAIDVQPNTSYTLSFKTKNTTAGQTYYTALVSSINSGGNTSDAENGKFNGHWQTWMNDTTNKSTTAGGNADAYLDACSFGRNSHSTTTNYSTVTYKFNTPAENVGTVYLLVLNGNGDLTIDDITLVANEKVCHAEVVDKNGDAIVDPSFSALTCVYTLDGTKVTFDATDILTFDGYEFLGWYVGDTKIADLENYENIDVSGKDLTTLCFKYSTENVLTSAASFENLETDVNLRVTPGSKTAPTGDQWAYYQHKTTVTHANNNNVAYEYQGGLEPTYEEFYGSNYCGTATETNAIDTYSYAKVLEDETANSGSQSLKVYFPWRNAVRALEGLAKNTDYKLSFYLKLGTDDAGTPTTVTSALVSKVAGIEIDDTDNFASGFTKLVVPTNTTSTETWELVELTFNSGDSETLYLQLRSGGSQGSYYIDDLTLVPFIDYKDITYVDTKGAALTTVNSDLAEVVYDKETTVGTVTVKSDYAEFLGWYKDASDLTEADSTSLTYNVAENGSAVPVVRALNVLESVAGSYEGYEVGADLKVAYVTGNAVENRLPSNGIWGENANTGYYDAVSTTTKINTFDGSEVTVSTQKDGARSTDSTFNIVQVEEGNNALNLVNSGFVPSMAISVEKNKNYTLTFKVKNENEEVYEGTTVKNRPTWMGITSSLNVPLLDETYDNSFGSLVACYTDSSDILKATEWKEVTFNFNSADLETVYLTISCRNKKDVSLFVDDMVLVEADLSEINNAINNTTNSIRTKDNALRFKLNVDSILDSKDSFLGGTVTEIGFLAIRQARLNEAALLPGVGTAYASDNSSSNATPKKTDSTSIVGSSAGWNTSGTDKTFTEEGQNGTHLRAALMNIGKFSSGATNFSYLGENYSVRLYIKINVDGSTQTVYSDTYSVSFFDYCKYVLENKETVAESDLTAVNDFLALEQVDTVNSQTRKQAYEAWVEKNTTVE